MLSLNWIKYTNGNYCEFKTFDLSRIKCDGVYVIWHGGNPGRVVYIGQGDVPSRIAAHRSRQDILSYAKYGPLFFTWAEVPQNQKDGVERYLADSWNPQVGEVHPAVSQIAVNSPWQ